VTQAEQNKVHSLEPCLRYDSPGLLCALPRGPSLLCALPGRSSLITAAAEVATVGRLPVLIGAAVSVAALMGVVLSMLYWSGLGSLQSCQCRRGCQVYGHTATLCARRHWTSCSQITGVVQDNKCKEEALGVADV